jgi:type I restriction enzyme S subunit
MRVATQNSTVPKLRFKEFKLNPIRAKKMSDFGSFYYGKSAPKHSLSDDAPTPCVRYGELYSKFGENISKIHSFTNIDPKNLKFSIGGEVLIPRVGEDPLDFGNASYLPIPNVAIGEMISVFNTNENGLFFTYYINGKLRKAFAKVVEGGSVSNLYFRYLEKIVVSIPPLPEQQKIASFLSAVDDRIQKLERKKSLLAAYKKGVMRQLFSQELRFKDEYGNKYPDWEEKKLGELDIYISDGNYGELYPKASDMKVSGVPFIRANNIKNLKLIWKDMRFIDHELHNVLTSGHLITGDILVTTRGDIGMVAIVSDDFNGANINAQICLLRSSKGLSSNYLLQFLGSSNGKKQFKQLQTGSALKQLPKGYLKKVKLPIPSYKEQQKIASFLSGVDKKIELIETQIQQSKTFKKGLLQQLFV